MLGFAQSSHCVRSCAGTRSILVTAVFACGLVPLCSSASAAVSPSFNVLYNFTGAPSGPSSDGAEALSNLTVGSDGSLYGTTEFGGTSGQGTIFRLSPPTRHQPQWTETVLYSFGSSPNDGANPYTGAGVTFGNDGSLYGVTANGGTYGDGTVYRLSPPNWRQSNWTETVLYSFGASSTDGTDPVGTPTLWFDGSIYGTTFQGGANGRGTVFNLTPPGRSQTQWIETIVYNFGSSSTDAANPNAGLTIGPNSGLYGTTASGGMYGDGAVFNLTPPHFRNNGWTENVLFSFGAYSTDGYTPYATVTFGPDGSIYSTTYNGGTNSDGTVFKLSPPRFGNNLWTETILYNFQGGNDGQNPASGVVFGYGGSLYGTTSFGGTSDVGTIYQVTPPWRAQGAWTETVLHSFDGDDGAYPDGGVTFGLGGALYGSTFTGGNPGPTQTGVGVVYQMMP